MRSHATECGTNGTQRIVRVVIAGLKIAEPTVRNPFSINRQYMGDDTKMQAAVPFRGHDSGTWHRMCDRRKTISPGQRAEEGAADQVRKSFHGCAYMWSPISIFPKNPQIRLLPSGTTTVAGWPHFSNFHWGWALFLFFCHNLLALNNFHWIIQSLRKK